MAFNPIVIDGGGKPEPDADLVKGRKEAAAALDEAESFWVLTVDDSGYRVIRYGDRLEQAALVEELGRMLKLSALGLMDDEE